MFEKCDSSNRQNQFDGAEWLLYSAFQQGLQQNLS